MELISHKAEPAPVPVMVGADLFQTQDVEEARQWGVRAFCENRLKKVDGLRPINARMHLRKVRGVGFGRITYGGAVDIDPGCLDSFYLVQVPLSGREVIDTGGQTVCSAGKVGSVINATGASLIRHEANTEKLVVRVEREVLERNGIQHLGHALRQPIGFQPSMTLDGVAGSRWTGLLRWIYESFAVDDQCFDSPIMSAQVEQTVIATLLSAQPHNYSEELNGEERSIAPAFVKRGIVPESGGTWFLPRMLGWAKASEIIFTGRTLSAEECLAEGLVNHVVPADQVQAEARRMAAEIAANAPLAVTSAKRMMRMGLEESFPTHVQHVYLQLLPLFASDDFKEGITSFLEKRPAQFTGR